jgi:hypothetical protein
MNRDPDRRSLAPWLDPDFAGHRPENDKSLAPGGGRRRRGRPWALGLVLGAVWLGLLLDPMLGPLILSMMAALGITLAVVAGAMGLGLVGTGLFAAGDRVVAWIRQGSRWPEE